MPEALAGSDTPRLGSTTGSRSINARARCDWTLTDANRPHSDSYTARRTLPVLPRLLTPPPLLHHAAGSVSIILLGYSAAAVSPPVPRGRPVSSVFALLYCCRKCAMMRFAHTHGPHGTGQGQGHRKGTLKKDKKQATFLQHRLQAYRTAGNELPDAELGMDERGPMRLDLRSSGLSGMVVSDTRERVSDHWSSWR